MPTFPAEFDYLFPLFEQCEQLGFGHLVEQYLDGISPSDLQALRTAYQEIQQRGHCLKLNEWIKSPRQTRDEKWSRHLAFTLLVLFDELGKRGIFPFGDERVRYDRTSAPRNWAIVPPEFAFLCESAERFGVMYGELGGDQTLASITPQDWQKLEAVAVTLHENHCLERLYKWLKTQESNSTTGAIDFLLAVLSSLELL